MYTMVTAEDSVKPTAKYVDECLDCTSAARKGCDHAFDGTEEFESAR